eukprot:67455-Amorphochlora_amoeboformis.AAC.1
MSAKSIQPLNDEDFARQLQDKFNNDRAQIAQDSKVARDLDLNSKFNCPVCMKSCPIESVFYSSGCKHLCCRKCARTWTKTEIYQSRFPVRCPECMPLKESKGEFHPKDIEGLLNPEELM